MTANGHGSVLWCHELCVTGSIFHLVDLQSRDCCIVESLRELSKTHQITINQLQPECVLTLWTSCNLSTVGRESAVHRHLASEISHNMPTTQNIFLHKSEREALWRQRKRERSHIFSCMCKGEISSIRTFSSSHVWETTRHFVTESLWLLTFPENSYHIHQLTILFFP